MARLVARFPGLTTLALSAVMAIAGCSTFRGPGEFVYGNQKPVLSTTGERIDSWSEGEISFDWPVDEARFVRGFLIVPESESSSKKGKSKKKRRSHSGIDLANRRGTPILAAQSGRVIYTGSGFRGYGRLVIIEHNNEWATFYSHLDKILVKQGQVVAKGQKIGLMGRTGRATGVHLHFEIRHQRRPVNPLLYLPPVPGSSSLRGIALAPREDSLHTQNPTQSELQ